jgi:cyclopropane fatty-acyl-phospholipid synthase-like methyltransferase
MAGEYYKTKESVQEYIEMSKEVNGNQLIEKLKQYLPPGSSVLEIGSGPGSDWEILAKTYSVTGSDFSAGFLAHLNTKYPDGKFLELNAITLDTTTRFDGIYANKVLHHLKNEELKASIIRQADVLNSKGIICFSFWQGEGDEVFKGMYVNYHTQHSLKKFFGEHFDILLAESYKEFDEEDSILLIARKK